MENNFNLKKFLIENKLTSNSRTLSEASGKSEALAKAKASHNAKMSKLKGQSQGASGGVTRAREDKEIDRYEKEVERINKKFTNNEVADSGDEMVLLSVSNRRLNASTQDISRIIQKKVPGTFYIVRGNGGEPNEPREVSREEALDYVEYYKSKTPPNLDQEKEELLGTKLKVLGWESQLTFRPDNY